MPYLLVFLLVLLMLFSYERSTKSAGLLILILLFFVVFFIPAFQYDIGSDYFEYYRFADDHAYLNYLKSKGELFFYFLYFIINYFDLNNQCFFIITSAIQCVLVINVAKLIKEKGGSPLWFMIGFFLITNIYHNQMNHIRTYIAVLFFINAMMYRFESKWVLCLVFATLSFFSHATSLVVIPLLLINTTIANFIIRYGVFFFFFSIFIYSADIYQPVLFFLVDNFFPFYKGYMNTLFLKKSNIYDLITRIYYFPLALWVTCFFYKYRGGLNDFTKFNASIFILTCNSYLLLLNSSVFLRFWSFFLIYYAISLGVIYKKRSNFKLMDALLFMYLLMPYIVKVVFFPVREFSFDLVFFH